MAMVGKILKAAMPFVVPAIAGKIGGEGFGNAATNAFVVGGAMHSASETGENPVIAGISAYAQQKLLYEPASAFLTAAGVSGPFGMGPMLAIQGAQLAGAFVVNEMQKTGKAMSQAFGLRGKFGSGHFNMTAPAYTMRQRSINAIRANGSNLESVFGNEARNYAINV